jgi:preprotein translocase subunit Sec61beta
MVVAAGGLLVAGVLAFVYFFWPPVSGNNVTRT